MDANSAYTGMRNSYQQQADTYGGKFNNAANDYLSMLSRPVGSDAEDSAILGRATESNAMNARRASARIANNPNVAASGGAAGALSSIEQRRMANDANLHAKVADMNLMQRRQRQEQIVGFLSRELAKNQNGLQMALSGQLGTNSQLLGMGRQEDANNRNNASASAQGMMQLLAQLGMGSKGNS